MAELMTTWRKELLAAGCPARDLEEATIVPSDLDLDREFNAGYGGPKGAHFLLWTEDRVYFPCVYDGSEVDFVPRHPQEGASLKHFGGG